jgi:hypothetical protein
VVSTQFSAGTLTAKAAIVHLSSSGRLSLWNDSLDPIQVAIYVDGYYVGGTPSQGGTYQWIAPKRLVDTRTGAGGNRRGWVGARSQFAAQITGHANIPRGAAALVGVLSAFNPTTAGTARVWKNGDQRPSSANLAFAKKSDASVLVTVPLSADGRVTMRNSGVGKVDLALDVIGYILATPALPSQASLSHYIRNINGGPGDATVMQALGAADAAHPGTSLVVLHIGAQGASGNGVLLSAVNTPLTYAELVAAIRAYLMGLGSVQGVTIAIATSNDNAGWDTYSAAARGTDWWTQVISQLQGTGVAVVGADDIEPGFASTAAQALSWESAYINAAGADQRLVFTGSADGCPLDPGSQLSCNDGWTQAQLYSLAGGNDPAHIQALPQIYNANQAAQWPNIDVNGGGQIAFLGALTEQQACAMAPDCVSWGPADGLSALVAALQTAALPIPTGLIATDLDIQQ